MLNNDVPARVAYEVETCEGDEGIAVFLGRRRETAIDAEGREGATGL